MASHAANPAEASTDLEPTNGVALNGSGKKLRDYTEVAYLTGRARVVTKHFPTAIGIDDFLHRLEIALYAYGFNGDNSIGESIYNSIMDCL